MGEDLKLYIPLGVKPETELVTGFGKKQLFQSIVGSLVMGCLLYTSTGFANGARTAGTLQ